MKNNISDIRNEYSKASLDEKDIGDSPIDFFKTWFDQAVHSEVLEPTAMTLATVRKDGMPDARIVLLKGIENEGFQFYTNYTSAKGKELESNPNACLVFFWAELERQVRIRGKISKVSRENSENYFHSRPFASQIGALASSQSDPVADRSILDKHYEELKLKYEGKTVPLPENWGGYVLEPSEIEFWQGRRSRLHDRILFRKESGSWAKTRLQP
ncbi:pyridoxamine 5'-phosphate oxidase [Leptospira licerasiae]|uniref:Pyridoxine/pyridoxamine 5'-phosphate oxidase n=1 Tax=Leptospira licerasiae str. MMD4847 TaxID=1049971 RepID=A0ABN0H896_9LEPT|nr:pyridoxamine 5'-phosphate oxidase [Leptospira licerasiae]EIE00095.1 pyridoxamine 5'-phosphate oxidase [Leptospira licerasiae serovar Varillal str. VAR 010]EJZ41972.1 pyridoxamine 5'-phosphate oxidase [Leptospira licerasiae str. MMD4847]TGM94810.1 pyridoxamine 5'-phosphate oxidase [Leptospira licerasiae]